MICPEDPITICLMRDLISFLLYDRELKAFSLFAQTKELEDGTSHTIKIKGCSATFARGAKRN